MTKMAFISRHQPTLEQVSLAGEQGFELVSVGDVDAFDSSAVLEAADGFTAAAVVHPWAAFTLAAAGKVVGIFENGQRAVEGGKPTFYAKALHIWGA